MATPAAITSVRQKYEALAPLLHEKAQRRWAACEALALGTGRDLPRLRRDRTLTPDHPPRPGRTQHHPGRRPRDASAIAPASAAPAAGRPRLTASDRSLLDDLRRLVDPATRGDPMSPLLWTCKSTRHLAEALGSLGHDVSHQTVAAS